MSSRFRALAGVAALVFAIAACGGSATSAPSSGQASAPPAATQAPASAGASDAPATAAAETAAPTDAGGAPDIGAATTALADLNSYKLKITMSMKGLEDSLFQMFGDGMDMTGTFVFKPEKAADLAISMGKAGQKLEMGYRIIGDKAWISLGGGWMETPLEDAQKTLDSFAADKMLGSFGSVGQLTKVGEETRNGVQTVHYTADTKDVANQAGDALGLKNGTWTVDLWVAKDGGYAVAYALSGKNDTQSLQMTLDVTDINSANNTIEVPATD